MAIKINGNDLQKRFIGTTEIVRVYKSGVQVRPGTPTVNYLCFTSASAFSVRLDKVGNPTSVNLEVSTDGSTRSDYTIGTTLSMASGSSLYMRNKSTTPTGFSTGNGDYYQFDLYGDINASGDITTLLCKNSTDTLLTDYCFYSLFNGLNNLLTAPSLPATTLTQFCYSLMFGSTLITTAPSLPATTLADWCYASMFFNCANLVTIPSLPATTLAGGCYSGMFMDCSSLATLPSLPATALTSVCYSEMFTGCTSIKLSETQTGDYQTPYTIPSSGTGAIGYESMADMFYNTGGTFTGTPSINTTYYTSNTVI